MFTSFEYELEMADGLDDTYTETLRCDVDFVQHTDSNYGADADGNRGVRAVFVEDVNVTVYNEEGKDVTNMIKAEFPADWTKIEEQADEAAADAE